MGERTGSEPKYSANGNGNSNGHDKEPNDFNVEKVMKELGRICFGYEIAALEHIEPLAQLLLDNPREGIQQIRSSYKKGVDAAYGKNLAMVNALCGGPAESLTWPLYNAVGAAYPYMDREQKDDALWQLFAILDKQNTAIITGDRGVGHTTGIREPLLITDISNVRPYWPGLGEGKWIIKQFENFSDLQSKLIDENGMFKPKSSAHAIGGGPSGVNSDFVVAYALLRKKYSDFGEYYMEVANPAFLERVIKGIITLNFGYIQSEKYLRHEGKEKSEKHIAKRRARLIELLPESIHHKIEPLRQEADWADPDKFP